MKTIKKSFSDVPIIGFKSNTNLKSHLVRAALPNINQEGRCEPCGGKRPPCQLYRHMKNTNFYQIKKSFNCNSKLVVHLTESRVCGVPYNCCTMTKLRARANNYKSRHHSFRKEQKLSNQARDKKRFRVTIMRFAIGR